MNISIFFILFTLIFSFQNAKCELKDLDQQAKDFYSRSKELVDQSLKVYNALKEGASIRQTKAEIHKAISESLSSYPLCNQCHSVIADLKNIALGQDSQTIFDFLLTTFCRIGYEPIVCNGIASEYGYEVIITAADREIDPQWICGQIFLCPKTYEKESLEDYINMVLADKPSAKPPKPTGRSTYKVLHLTDAHFDDGYQTGGIANCNLPECCRVDSEVTKGETPIYADYWGTLAQCDTPFRTVQQLITWTSNNLDPDMILWTGDSTSHDVWEQNTKNQTLNTYNITVELDNHWPNTQIYPIFGNHECFPADQYDVFQNSTFWLLSDLGQIWQNWINDQEAFSEFMFNGYYSLYDEERNLKIIALNTEVCDTINFFLMRNPNDPLGQLAWLRNELYLAEANNQNVWIIGHIPPGDYYCDYRWGARYAALIDRFSAIIRGQFFGHTHQDQFEVFKSYLDESPVGVAYITPSVTTYSYQNPSIRVFEVDTDTNLPVNIYQYRLNLTYWNSLNTTGPIEWDLAYTQLDEYDMPDMTFESFNNLSQRLQQNKTLQQIYDYNFWAGGAISGPPDEKNATIEYCSAQNSNFLDMLECSGILNFGGQELVFFAAQYFQGAWYKNLTTQLRIDP